MSLQAFSNEIQFSCKNTTNQFSQNSRLNWFTFPNECPQWSVGSHPLEWRFFIPPDVPFMSEPIQYLKGDDLG
jgi:hypothetical protein